MEDTKHSDDSHPERPLAPSDASDARAEDTTATQAPEQGKSVAAEGTPALTSDIHGTPSSERAAEASADDDEDLDYDEFRPRGPVQHTVKANTKGGTKR